MTGMDITVHSWMLPHDDSKASVAYYRDTSASMFGTNVEYDGPHWITVGPLGQPETSVVLYRPRPPPASPTTSAAPWPR